MSMTVQAPRVAPVRASQQVNAPASGDDDPFAALLAAQGDAEPALPGLGGSASSAAVRPSAGPRGARTQGAADESSAATPDDQAAATVGGSDEPRPDDPTTAEPVTGADPGVGSAALLALAAAAAGQAGTTSSAPATASTQDPAGRAVAPASVLGAQPGPGSDLTGVALLGSAEGTGVAASAQPAAGAAEQAGSAATETGSSSPAPGPAVGAAASWAGSPVGSAAGDPSGEASGEDSGGASGAASRGADASSSAASTPTDGSDVTTAGLGGKEREADQQAAPAVTVHHADPTATTTVAASAQPAPVTSTTPAASSAAPTAATATPDPTPAPLAQQLGVRLTALSGLAAGTHVLSVPIDPENLGPVRVVARISARSVRVELVGATDASREALRGALDELRRDLASAGLPTSVDVSSGDSASTERGGSGPDGDGGATAGEHSWSSAPAAEPAVTSTPVVVAHTGRLDLVV